ncbi:MAG: hypothetical protein HDR19_05305 [Lachnospiraceae bacterium]|nr:hypothetical protein [Lachnospiraceae bacterium]
MDRFGQNMDNADSSVSVSVEYDKYKRIIRKNTVPDGRVLVFLTGFCLGMVFFYLSGIKLVGEERFPAALSADYVARLGDFDFYAAGLFEYVTVRRLGQLVLILICATSFMRGIFSYTFLGWGGFEIGIVMFSLVYQYGIKGLLLSVMLFIPHGIFFLVSFLLLFDKSWIGDKNAYHNYDAITEKGLHNKLTKVKKIGLILLLWGVGILTEVYINPEIIKKMALFFK